MTVTTQSVRKSIPKSLQQVGARVYASGNLASGGGWVKINFNQADYDLGTNFDLALYKFTVPITGLYHISLLIHWVNATITSGDYYCAGIYKNGSLFNYACCHASRTDTLHTLVVDEVFLQENDYIEFYANAEAAATVQADSYGIVRLITTEGIRQ